MALPVVTVASGGLAVTDASSTGIGLPIEEATNGFGLAVTYVASGGLAVVGGAGIQLSAATVADTAAVGTVIGTLSVNGGTGTYTFSLSSNPGGLFSITGAQLKVAAALSAGSDPITVHADNGAGSVFNRSFLISVTHAGAFVPTFELLGF